MKWLKTFEEHIPKGHILYPDIIDDNGFLKSELVGKLLNYNQVNKNLGFSVKSPVKIDDNTIKFETYINLYKDTIFDKTFEYYTDKEILFVSLMYKNLTINDYSFTFNFGSDSITSELSENRYRINTNIIFDKNTKNDFLIRINQKFYDYLKEKASDSFLIGYKSLYNKNESIEIPFIRQVLVKCISYSTDLTKEIVAKIFLNEIKNCKDAGPILQSMKNTEWYEIFSEIDQEAINSLSDSNEMGLYD
jgi:hypothetical protein